MIPLTLARADQFTAIYVNPVHVIAIRQFEIETQVVMSDGKTIEVTQRATWIVGACKTPYLVA